MEGLAVMEKATILLLDFNLSKELSDTLQFILGSSFAVKVHSQQAPDRSVQIVGDDWPRAISRCRPDLVFLILPGDLLRQEGSLIRSVADASAKAPLVIVTEEVESHETFDLLKLGVVDYITPPLTVIDIVPRVRRLLERSQQGVTINRTLKERFGLKQLIGNSPSFLAEIAKIPLVAECDAGVLIYGETGTGKELYARAIHYLSPRSDKPFVPVNCGAIPLDLIENELFGHASGAFTSAQMSQRGLLNEAEGGTLFLDEVDCLPHLAQVKLLRFLQEKEYRPLGSSKMCQADVRVIAASNVDFDEAVREGKLRRDFYYRLNVLMLKLPPLRERGADIALLAHHFLQKFAEEFGRQGTEILADAMQLLMLYDWPGNVRELEHIIKRAMILSRNGVICCADLNLPCGEKIDHRETFREAKANVVKQFEKAYLQKLLLAHQGNITWAAQAAHKNRRALWQLIRKHNIDVQNFKPSMP